MYRCFAIEQAVVGQADRIAEELHRYYVAVMVSTVALSNGLRSLRRIRRLSPMTF